MPKLHPCERKLKARDLLAEGYTQEEVAEMLEVCSKTIQRDKKKLQA